MTAVSASATSDGRLIYALYIVTDDNGELAPHLAAEPFSRR
jgi:hypothetical protein